MEFAEAAASVGRFRFGELRERTAARESGGWDGGSNFTGEKEEYPPGRHRSAAAVRLWQLWLIDAGGLQFESLEPVGSRDGVCDCSYSRRRRAWEAVARCRAHAQKDEYVHRFYCVRGFFGGQALFVAGAHGH